MVWLRTAAVVPDGMIGWAPAGLITTVKGWLGAMVSYMVANITVPRYPWDPPPRLDGMEAAFSFNLLQRQVRESYVGWPGTLFGWMGKLLVKASVEGTEEAMVAVGKVVMCYNNVGNKRN
jgi:hypothetical protein